MNTEKTAPAANDDIASALELALAATRGLTAEGITVICGFANGRRPVLYVDRMPDGVVSVVKRSHPNGSGGTTVVRAAPYCGCQLEWMHDVYNGSQAAALQAAQQRHLEVVRG